MAPVSPEPSDNRKPSPYNNYLRYSGLALQILLTIGVCGWLGYKLDQYLGLQYPVFLMVLGMAGFSGIIYKTYRSINRPDS